MVPARKPGQAGDQPGIDYLETEIDIDELIEMMMEDLGLPNLQRKEVAQRRILNRVLHSHRENI